MKPFASSKNAIKICQRSGFKYPYDEVVVEPGTGLMVHYTESDGYFNRVNNPQLHIKGEGDAIAIPHPFTNSSQVVDYLVDENGEFILGDVQMFGVQEYVIV
jgi:hypothetical protein